MAVSDKSRADAARGVTPRMILLTVSLLGLQFTWSVEMAQGTPFLLSLGLPKSLSAMVWLAGPLSGFIMQPIVGAYSDACRSRFGRRRPFMVAGSFAVIFSFMLIGWTREVATLLSAGGASTRATAQVIAVIAFYVLDFAINTVQASCRALIIDAAGKRNQEAATAWAGRMIGAGNVIGYLMGYFDLVAAFPILGNTQLKVLCVLASFFLAVCVGLTCWAIKENPSSRPRSPAHGNPFHALTSALHSFRHVPPIVQRLCNVQFFAWIGWFPFLFYTTSWVTEVLARSSLANPVRGSPIKSTDDTATRAGSFALFMFSVVSLVSSTLLPLAVAGSRDSGSGSGSKGSRAQLQADGRDAINFTRNGSGSQKRPILERVLRRLRDGVPLTTAYTASHVLFAACMLLTPIAYSSVPHATFLVATCGIPWSVAMWAPFCILGESVAGKKPIRLRRRRRGNGTNKQQEEAAQPLVPAAASFAGDSGEREQASRNSSSFGSGAEEKRAELKAKGSDSDQDLDRPCGEASPDLAAREHAPPFSAPSPTRTSKDSLRSRGVSPCRIHVGDEGDWVTYRNGQVAAGFAEAVGDGADDEDDESEIEEDVPDDAFDDWAFEVRDMLGHGGTPSPTDIMDDAPRGDRNELDGGAILGIHNCYCVAPQFITALLSSMVFAALEPASSNSAVSLASPLPSSITSSASLLTRSAASPVPTMETRLGGYEAGPSLDDTDAIGWVLRMGGLSALVAAYLSLKIK